MGLGKKAKDRAKIMKGNARKRAGRPPETSGSGPKVKPAR
jgi:hypothetical protein